ncbi:hypothetical protein J6590_055934, partial [Homalodisca vitripennis]
MCLNATCSFFIVKGFKVGRRAIAASPRERSNRVAALNNDSTSRAAFDPYDLLLRLLNAAKRDLSKRRVLVDTFPNTESKCISIVIGLAMMDGVVIEKPVTRSRNANSFSRSLASHVLCSRTSGAVRVVYSKTRSFLCFLLTRPMFSTISNMYLKAEKSRRARPLRLYVTKNGSVDVEPSRRGSVYSKFPDARSKPSLNISTMTFSSSVSYDPVNSRNKMPKKGPNDSVTSLDDHRFSISKSSTKRPKCCVTVLCLKCPSPRSNNVYNSGTCRPSDPGDSSTFRLSSSAVSIPFSSAWRPSSPRGTDLTRSPRKTRFS